MQFDRPESPQKMSPPTARPGSGERHAGPLQTEKEMEDEKRRRKEDPNWWREPQ